MNDESQYSDKFESHSAKSATNYSEERDFKDFSKNNQLFSNPANPTEARSKFFDPSPDIKPMPEFTPDEP